MFEQDRCCFRYLVSCRLNHRPVQFAARWFRSVPHWILAGLLCAVAVPPVARAQSSGQVHGLWVWKGPEVAQDARGQQMLRDFCAAQGINEIYISVSSHGELMPADSLAHLISLLHRAGVRVEALLSSEDADEPGPHREKLLDHVRAILAFDQAHAESRFDGIHLDIEPQQRPENKGAGNLRFLPGLVDAYAAVLTLARSAHLTVNADIQNKLLKGTAAERRSLLTSLPRLTLMLYELSSPGDGESTAQQTDKVRSESRRYLDMAYDGLGDANVAKMAIGLRTPDYGDQLPAMLNAVDEANGDNPHFLGSARHSYNDAVGAP
jgi:hypothetical protein